MQNGAKETDGKENAAERVISAIERRKEKARRSGMSHFFGQMVAADIRWQRDMLVYRFTDAITTPHHVKLP